MGTPPAPGAEPRHRLNKKVLDFWAQNSAVVAILAGMSYNKDLLQLFPPAWTPYITYISATATVVLKVMAYYAPPTPSPLPPAPGEPAAPKS